MKKIVVLAVLALCSLSLFAQEIVVFKDHRALEVRNHRQEKEWTYLTIGSGEMAVRTADILKIVKENVTSSPAPVQADHPVPPRPPVQAPRRAPATTRRPVPPHGLPPMFRNMPRPPNSVHPAPSPQHEQKVDGENAEEEDRESFDQDEEENEPPEAPQASPSTAPRRVTIPLRTTPKTRGGR